MARTRRKNRGPGAAPENRAALLDAARVVFSDSGLDVPLNSIAKTAGVSQGVLYRHFPDRMDLVLAVFEENTTALEELCADRKASLQEVLDFVTAQAIESVAFVDMINASTDDPRVDRVAHRIADALAEKLEPARDSGQVRSDVSPEDLVVAIGMIANLMAKLPAAERWPTAERAWALLRSGLDPR